MSAHNRSARRIPSLPLTDASTLASSSSRARHRPSSSTLTGSISPPSHIAPSSTGSHSTPSSWGRKTQMSRRSGGFLLDGSGIGSLEGGRYSENPARERSDRERDAEYERESSNYPEPSTARIEREAEERDTVDLSEFPIRGSDADPAKIISLALGLSETRRRGARSRSVSSSRRLPDILDEKEAGHGVWHGRELGPTSPAESALGRQLPPLNPPIASPPPPAGGTTGKQNFSPVSPLSLPLPTAPYQQLQSKRSALAQHQQQLREFREQYQPTEATLQRALKAKQQLELSSLYKRLLTIYPTQDLPFSGSSAHGTPNKGDIAGPYSHERAFNPLMAIRNKRFRNRERIKLELSSWDDPGAVEQWIEDLAVAIHDSEGAKTGLPKLPPPPHPSGRTEEKKRPRMDWVISPQELLADFYWMEESERLRMEQTRRVGGRIEEKKQEGRRETHLSLKSLIDREEKRARSPSRVRKRSIRDLGDPESGDDISRRDTGDSSKKRSKPGFMERGPLQPSIQLENDVGYHSACTSQGDSSHSSGSEGTYDDEMSGAEVDSDIDQKAKKKHSKRKRLGKIITSTKPGRRKKTKKKRISDTHVLSPEEKRRRQEQEEMEWMVEMGDRLPPPRRSYSGDEDTDPTTTLALARATADKTAGVGGVGPGASLPTTLGGSRSSLERFGPTGPSAGRRSLDFGEIVVPSIAISLSPPRATPRGEDEDMDLRGRTKRKDEMEGTSDEKRKASPTKKLLEKSMEAMGRERESSYDRYKESIDSDNGRKLKDKDKDGSAMGRVKSRVERIRSEVAKVEDFIWRRDAEKGGSTLSSPTGSSFAEAESSGYRSEDDRGRLVREDTFPVSEAEDEGRSSKRSHGRSPTEVPEGPALGPPRLGNHPSTPALPTISKIGTRDNCAEISSDEEGRRRRSQKSNVNLEPTRSYTSRDPSPARAINVLSIGDRNGVKSGVVTQRGNENNGPGLEKGLPIMGNSDGKGPAVSKQELVRARAYLLASGVVSRGITSGRAGTTVLDRTSNDNNSVGIMTLAKKQMYSTDAVSREIASVEEEFIKKSREFTTSTVVDLKGLVDNIKYEIETRLATLLGEVADGADELNGELTTKCTLAVKAVNDDLSNVMRRKRRKFRRIRGFGFVTLEWVVLGVMWWVWLVVVIIRFLRVMVTGVVRGVRWILWI